MPSYKERYVVEHKKMLNKIPFLLLRKLLQGLSFTNCILSIKKVYKNTQGFLGLPISS